MPRAWSRKDERQYEHILASELQRGRSRKVAKEIAARTVNEQRRTDGRTERKTSGGTGNPDERLEARSKQQLYNRARDLDIEGRSRMNKSELVRAIRQHEG